MKLKTNVSLIKQYLQRHSKIIFALESFFSTWAIMRIGNLHSMNILAFLFFLLGMVFFSVLQREIALQKPDVIKKQSMISGLFAVVFTVFYLLDTGKTLVSDLSNKLFQLAILLAVASGLFILLYHGIRYLMCKFNSFTLADSQKGGKIVPYLPVICFVICILCRIPWLLYSYPGIMTPDSINQFEQVIGMKPFSNHHPWLHTLTISLFYHIGTLFKTSLNDAFAFYTIFQICFMAFAASYLIWVISKYTKSIPLLSGMIAVYAFLPYHNVMALCIWKDVMFAGTLLIFCTSLFHLLRGGIKKSNWFSMMLYFISGFLMCLYRSNGWYAFILTFPFLLIVFRRQWKVMYPLHFAMLLLVLVVKGPVMEHYEVKQPDFIESISIPLQQVGRVIATGQELTGEQNELINKVIDSSQVPKLYTEYISDNMKELVRANHPEYLVSHKAEFLKLWIELGLKYPDVYLDAYVAQTRGYYSPAAVYSVAEVDGIIASETGLYREYLISGRLIVKIREILIKLQDMIPLYGALWSMGSLFWGTLLFLGLSLGRRILLEWNSKLNSLELITVWLPNISVIITLLIATPVAIEFRYAYNLAYCIPLYFAIMMTIKEKE